MSRPALGIAKLAAVISNDTYAMSFQNLGQYRSALLKHAQEFAAEAATASRTSHEAADLFAQALIEQGWYNPDPECVDGLQALLDAFLATQKAVTA